MTPQPLGLRQSAYPLADKVFGSVRRDSDSFYFIVRASKGTVMTGGLYQRRYWDGKSAHVPFGLVAEFVAKWSPGGWNVRLTKTVTGEKVADVERRLYVPRILNCIENSGVDIVGLIEGE